jgi:hypothetical protein
MGVILFVLINGRKYEKGLISGEFPNCLQAVYDFI